MFPTRREFLWKSGSGFGALALMDLLAGMLPAEPVVRPENNSLTSQTVPAVLFSFL